MTVDIGRVDTTRLASIIVLTIGTGTIATTTAVTGDTTGNGAIVETGGVIIATVRARPLPVRCMGSSSVNGRNITPGLSKRLAGRSGVISGRALLDSRLLALTSPWLSCRRHMTGRPVS